MQESRLYLGLMSGTSADAVDVVATDFSGTIPHLVGSLSIPTPAELKESIHSISVPGINEIDRMGQLDHALGLFFSEALNQLIDLLGIDRASIRAIGSHGQTIRHRPPGSLEYPFTLQIGDPNIIAQQTGITTIGDFRRRDMAAGGQGAPLVPAFHQAIFHSQDIDRVVINIGGMANISWIPRIGHTTGFDTGPGNVLLDGWILRHLSKNYDANGDWGGSGTMNKPLLDLLMQHPFFAQPHPKSTGREVFNLDWLDSQLAKLNTALAPDDIQATLVELTAISITTHILKLSTEPCEAFVCGGGAFNRYLMERIALHLHNATVNTTQALGVAPQWVESMAFAWLAKQTMEHKPGNLTAVTGAKEPVILGGVYFA